MTFHEFIGKSVKEAIAKACQQLDSTEDKLEIEVIEESTRGFLGIVGQRDARIRVQPREVCEEHAQAPPSGRESNRDSIVIKGPVQDLPTENSGSEVEPQLSSDFAASQQSSVIEQAQTVLEGILQRIPVEVEVFASLSGSSITLNILGDGSGLLIGKKGHTLDALQFLMNKIINKSSFGEGKTEIIVDTEHYRQKKSQILRETALRMSEKAKRTLKPVSLNPMPPSERRIVHMILAEDNEVYTKSYGEGSLRRIIIYPRRGGANKRRRR